MPFSSEDFFLLTPFLLSFLPTLFLVVVALFNISIIIFFSYCVPYEKLED